MTQTVRSSFASCIALPAMARSISTARLYTRDRLQTWRLMAMTETTELVVSELVTNAIKATNEIPPNARYPELYDRLEVVCLCLQLLANDVLVEVWDPKQEPPQPRTVTLDDEGGRGLFLVESLAKHWGTRWPRTGGKVVWATIPTNDIF